MSSSSILVVTTIFLILKSTRKLIYDRKWKTGTFFIYLFICFRPSSGEYIGNISLRERNINISTTPIETIWIWPTQRFVTLYWLSKRKFLEHLLFTVPVSLR